MGGHSALARISRASGISVVMGSGCYVAHSYVSSSEVDADAVAGELVRDITNGVDRKGIRSDEVGGSVCSRMLQEREVMVLRGACRALRHTMAP